MAARQASDTAVAVIASVGEGLPVWDLLCQSGRRSLRSLCRSARDMCDGQLITEIRVRGLRDLEQADGIQGNLPKWLCAEETSPEQLTAFLKRLKRLESARIQLKVGGLNSLAHIIQEGCFATSLTRLDISERWGIILVGAVCKLSAKNIRVIWSVI